MKTQYVLLAWMLSQLSCGQPFDGDDVTVTDLFVFNTSALAIIVGPAGGLAALLNTSEAYAASVTPWDSTTASLYCRDLEYETTNPDWSEIELDTLSAKVVFSCSGTEASILDCSATFSSTGSPVVVGILNCTDQPVETTSVTTTDQATETTQTTQSTDREDFPDYLIAIITIAVIIFIALLVLVVVFVIRYKKQMTPSKTTPVDSPPVNTAPSSTTPVNTEQPARPL